MKQHRALFFLCLLLFLASLSGLQAQDTMTSTHFDMSAFPLWARDLRRFEIIMFGSFPFAYFFTTFGYDTYRWSNNGWDTRYAPWPITSAGAIEPGKGEKLMTLGVSAGVSVLIAVVDYGIMRYRRNRLERESSKISEGNQIIVRRPLYESESDGSAEAAGENVKSSTELSATE